MKNGYECRDCWSCADADTGINHRGICVYLCMPEVSHPQAETILLLNGRDHMLTNMKTPDHTRWQHDVKSLKHCSTQDEVEPSVESSAAES
jgi:hypothetical protein